MGLAPSTPPHLRLHPEMDSQLPKRGGFRVSCVDRTRDMLQLECRNNNNNNNKVRQSRYRPGVVQRVPGS